MMKTLQSKLPGMISAVMSADRGSFTAAAKALNLTPAAVSKNVGTLEELLHVRLFNRTTRHLSLTEEGKAFVTRARAGLLELEAASEQSSRGQKPEGLLRVNAPVGIGRKYILTLLPGFYAKYPDVQVELNLNDQAVDLVGERFDVGIRGGSQPPEGMVARKICSLSVVLVATPKYLKQRGRGIPMSYRDLEHHDILRVKFHTGRMLPWFFKERVNGAETVVMFKGEAKLMISDPDVILEAALLDMGIAGMGRYTAYEALARGALVEVLPRQLVRGDNSLSMFYPHREGLAPRVRVFVDHVLAKLAKEPSLHG
jgi:DNA-binding transcriptional LysR family regulator